jgi:hypothetical protein
MMDFHTNKIIHDLEEQADKNHANLRIEMMPYTVEWRAAKKLKEFSDKIDMLEHKLLVLETQSEAWHKALVDQLKENVALKAHLLKDEVK